MCWYFPPCPMCTSYIWPFPRVEQMNCKIRCHSMLTAYHESVLIWILCVRGCVLRNLPNITHILEAESWIASWWSLLGLDTLLGSLLLANPCPALNFGAPMGHPFHSLTPPSIPDSWVSPSSDFLGNRIWFKLVFSVWTGPFSASDFFPSMRRAETVPRLVLAVGEGLWDESRYVNVRRWLFIWQGQLPVVKNAI